VGGKVLVSLLVSGVLGDEVKVLSADDEGAVHLGGDNGSGQDTTTDGDETCEGAFLVWKSEKLVSYPPSSCSLLSVYPRLLIHVPLIAGAEPPDLIDSHTDVGALDGSVGSLEAETDIFKKTLAAFACTR